MLLIVDDDPKFLQAAEELLDRGRGVFLAATAEQAKELLSAAGGMFSLAIISLDLLRQDGFSLIREIRQCFPELPTIAVGDAFEERILANASGLGAVDTLKKPITPEWNSAIAKACERAAAD